MRDPVEAAERGEEEALNRRNRKVWRRWMLFTNGMPLDGETHVHRFLVNCGQPERLRLVEIREVVSARTRPRRKRG